MTGAFKGPIESLVRRVGVIFALVILSSGAFVSAQQPGGLRLDLQSLAPEQCWFYTGWDLAHEPRADSANPAERLMAEADVRAFVDDVLRRLVDAAPLMLGDAPAAKHRSLRKVAGPVLEGLLKRGGCIYLEHLELPQGDGPPAIHGAVWLDVGSAATEVAHEILSLIEQPASDETRRTLGGYAFYHVDVDDAVELDAWLGSVDSYVVLAFGWDRLGQALQRRQAGSAPGWLTELQGRRPLNRTTGAGYINVAAIYQTLAPMGGAELVAVLETLGLDQLAAIETHSGYSETETVNWASFRLNGPPRGLFALAGDQGLTAGDLARVPGDALFASGLSFDAMKLLDLIEKVMVSVDPRGAEEMAGALEMFHRETGVDLERDLLRHIGSSWLIYNGAADGWLTGLTLSVDVSNADRVAGALERLVSVVQQEAGGHHGGPRFTRQSLGGQTVHTLRIPGVPMPFEPSWCVADGRLVITLYPSSLSAAIGQVDYEPLLDADRFNVLRRSMSQDERGRLVGFSYTDTKRQFEIVYPYVQILVSMGQSMLQEMGGPMPSEMEAVGAAFEGLQLPPARVIHRHLQPSWGLLSQHAEGIDWENRQTLPSVNVALAVPLGLSLTLPAVQQVRGAARRVESSNNMRQILIAAHNFHDAHGGLPVAYSIDAEGRPLLSWRVHLLPYLNEGHLYEQFRLDEPWDSEHNQRLLEQMPAVYQSPTSFADQGMTVYRGVGGPRGALISPNRPDWLKGRSISTIVDGSVQTLFLIETSDEYAIPWTKPDPEIQPDEFDFFALFGNHPGGTNVIFCDGSSVFLPMSIGEESLRHLMMVDDGFWVDLDFHR